MKADRVVRNAIVRALAAIEGIPFYRRPPRPVRDRWTLPIAPVCPECGAVASAVAAHTGEGWILGWECDVHGPDAFAWDDGDPGIGDPPEWPFFLDFADCGDFEAAGFLVV